MWGFGCIVPVPRISIGVLDSGEASSGSAQEGRKQKHHRGRLWGDANAVQGWSEVKGGADGVQQHDCVQQHDNPKVQPTPKHACVAVRTTVQPT